MCPLHVPQRRLCPALSSSGHYNSPSIERMVLVAPLQDAADALVVGLVAIHADGLLLEVMIRPESIQLPQAEDAVVTEAVQVRGRLTQVAEQVFFQGWFRDPLAAKTTNLSDGLQVTFIP